MRAVLLLMMVAAPLCKETALQDLNACLRECQELYKNRPAAEGRNCIRRCRADFRDALALCHALGTE